MRKLIRNKIIDIIKEEQGKDIDPAQFNIRKMSEWEFDYALRLKLHEEWEEAWKDPCPEEFADCLEVLKVAAASHGIKWADVEQARIDKVEKKGSFDCMWELTLK